MRADGRRREGKSQKVFEVRSSGVVQWARRVVLLGGSKDKGPLLSLVCVPFCCCFSCCCLLVHVSSLLFCVACCLLRVQTRVWWGRSLVRMKKDAGAAARRGAHRIDAFLRCCRVDAARSLHVMLSDRLWKSELVSTQVVMTEIARGPFSHGPTSFDRPHLL